MNQALVIVATVVIFGVSAFQYFGDGASKPIVGKSQAGASSSGQRGTSQVGRVGHQMLGGVTSMGRFGVAAGQLGTAAEQVGTAAEQIGSTGRRVYRRMGSSEGQFQATQSYVLVTDEQVAELAVRANLAEDKVRGFSDGWGFYPGALVRDGSTVAREFRRGDYARYEAMLGHIQRGDHEAALSALGQEGAWRGSVVAASEEIAERVPMQAFDEARRVLGQSVELEDISPQGASLLLPFTMLANDAKAQVLVRGSAPKDTFFDLLEKVRPSGVLSNLQVERMEVLNNLLNMPTRFRSAFHDKLEAVFGPDAFVQSHQLR